MASQPSLHASYRRSVNFGSELSALSSWRCPSVPSSAGGCGSP